MGFERVERRGGDPSRVGTAAALVAVIAAIVGGTAFGGSLRGQQRADLEFDGFETGTALTIAQVCFGVVLAALLTIAGCWWSAGRRRADVVAWAACWCALIGGGTALAMTAGRDAGLLDSPQAIVVWLATLVPAAMLVTFLVLALRGPGTSGPWTAPIRRALRDWPPSCRPSSSRS